MIKKPLCNLFTIILALMMISCASLKRKGSSSFDNSSSPYVKEEKQLKESDTKKQKKIVVKEEKVKIIEDDNTNPIVGNFCVIIGSFKVLENARNYKIDLIKKNFIPTLLKNESGLFRVAVATYKQEKPAREKIAEIRSRFPDHADVWLLIKK